MTALSGYHAHFVDAIIHPQMPHVTITFICERCKSPNMILTAIGTGHKKMVDQDVYLSTEYIFRCLDCNAIEMDQIITFIPSWVASQHRAAIDRAEGRFPSGPDSYWEELQKREKK